MVALHLSQIKQEDVNIVLRYLGFALSWIAKSKDGWDQSFYEVCVVVLFLLILVFQYATNYERLIKKIDQNAARFGLLSILTGLLLFSVLEWGDLTSDSRISRICHALVSGGLNACSGAAMYFFWKSVPFMKEKDDESLMALYV
jgi:hypothetical protein